MDILFYIAASIAIVSTFLVISRANAVHALLYLIVSLLSVAFIFYTLGAPFIAALEVMVYAGAIMVLFIFVIMILNMGEEAKQQEKLLLKPSTWWGPSILTLILIIEIITVIYSSGTPAMATNKVISPQQVGMSLFGPYMICVELSAMLLMAGIIGAYHLGKRKKQVVHRYLEGGSQ